MHQLRRLLDGSGGYVCTRCWRLFKTPTAEACDGKDIAFGKKS